MDSLQRVYLSALSTPRGAIDFYGSRPVAPVQAVGAVQKMSIIVPKFDGPASQSAVQFYERSAALAHSFGDRACECAALANLGEVHLALNQPICAVKSYEQAMAIARETSNLAMQEQIQAGLDRTRQPPSAGSTFLRRVRVLLSRLAGLRS